MTARLASVIRRWVGRAARWRGRRGRDRRRWPRFRPDSRRRRFSMPRWVTPVPDGRWRAWPPCDPGEPVLGQQGVRLCLPAASGSAASASSAFPATSVGSMSRAWPSYSVMSHRATIRSSACCGSRPALAGLRNVAAPALGWFSIRMVTAGRAHLMLLLSAARRRVLRAPRLVSAHLQRRPGRHRRRGRGRCAAPVMAGDVLSPDALGSAVADRPDAVRWCGASFDHQVGRGWGLRSLAQVTDGPDGPDAGWES